jgi:hypothetical protein
LPTEGISLKAAVASRGRELHGGCRVELERAGGRVEVKRAVPRKSVGHWLRQMKAEHEGGGVVGIVLLLVVRVVRVVRGRSVPGRTGKGGQAQSVPRRRHTACEAGVFFLSLHVVVCVFTAWPRGRLEGRRLGGRCVGRSSKGTGVLC